MKLLLVISPFALLCDGVCPTWLQVIKSCTELLTADKANIMVLSKRYAEPGFCTQKEKWFKTPYKVEG